MGFKGTIGDASILNFGDTALVPERDGIPADLLIVPIDGLGSNASTVEPDEALEAVKLADPQLVHTLCHYSVPFSGSAGSPWQTINDSSVNYSGWASTA